MDNTDVISNMTFIPYNLINSELTGLYGNAVLEDMGKIIKLYNVYEKGAEVITEGAKGDYVPADLKFKTARTLIDKEARFLFSRKPDLLVSVEQRESERFNKQAKQDSNTLQNLIDAVLLKNNISKKLLQAAKDCFIGKRVACFLNFDNENGGIGIRFAPSLEFIFDVDSEDCDRLIKIVAFYTVKDNKNKAEQEIYKKKYWMEDGVCWVEEAIYDGVGRLKEEITPARKTLFTYIPAVVIINDGLTGDLQGESEIGQLEDYESWYSRLANSDMDAERKGMNPIKWARDMSPESTKGLSSAAGSFWDLQTDQNSADGTTGEVGVLESSMGYSTALDTTLKRIKGTMYQQVDVPDIAELQGKLSSGKELKAIYWGLIVRCDEKMIVWRTALEFIVHTIIEGARLYPISAQPYVKDAIPDVEFSVVVDNQYPLPEDEIEEKQMDIIEVNANTMSRKSYIKKWKGLNDEEADAELQQIALERQLLEESFMSGMTNETM